jgi:hypothetical protein
MGISAYSNVRAIDGGERRADAILAGDELFDPLAETMVTVRKIWEGPAVGMMRITADNGTVLDLTEDQTVLTDVGRMAAGKLAAGIALQTPDGWTYCSDAHPLMGDYMVYDISLDKGDCILVNGVMIGVS